MKSFWWSLIGFCVLMCSCKTQKVVSDINVVSKESVQTEWSKFRILVDSSTIYKNFQDKSKLTITETIITKKYDKDTGVITEETTTEREIAQDSDKVVAEEENKSVTDCNGLKAEQFRESTKKVDSEVKEESIGGQESFGKWLGIGIACVIAGIIIYLWKRFFK